MTFKQFERTINHFRKDVIVSKHGDYCSNKSRTTLGIIFIKDEKKSKVYDFSGTYFEVLTKLGITDIYEKEDVAFIESEIKRLNNQNGKINLFTGMAIDNSMEIKKLEDRLNSFSNLYMVV